MPFRAAQLGGALALLFLSASLNRAFGQEACGCSCPAGSEPDGAVTNDCKATDAGCTGSCGCKPKSSTVQTLCSIGLGLPALCARPAGVCGGSNGRCTESKQCLSGCSGGFNPSGSVPCCNDGHCACCAAPRPA